MDELVTTDAALADAARVIGDLTALLQTAAFAPALGALDEATRARLASARVSADMAVEELRRSCWSHDGADCGWDY